MIQRWVDYTPKKGQAKETANSPYSVVAELIADRIGEALIGGLPDPFPHIRHPPIDLMHRPTPQPEDLKLADFCQMYLESATLPK